MNIRLEKSKDGSFTAVIIMSEALQISETQWLSEGGILTRGDTLLECMDNLKEAVLLHVGPLFEGEYEPVFVGDISECGQYKRIPYENGGYGIVKKIC